MLSRRLLLSLTARNQNLTGFAIQFQRKIDPQSQSSNKNSIRSLSTTNIQKVEVQHEFHSIIKWNRPEKLKCWDPLISCDVRELPKLDPDLLRLEYRPFADILDSLPPDQRKLFTIDHGKRRDQIDLIMEDTCNKVKRHQYDKESPEFKVAWMTVKIRSYQDLLLKTPFPTDKPYRKNGFIKVRTHGLIGKRHKYLTTIKNQDYKKFEWLLQILGIIFKPLPQVYCPVQRKRSLRYLTTILCDTIKNQKMHEYKLDLENQKMPFLQEKLTTLMAIKADEDSMGIPCSVEDVIIETEKRLEVLQKTHVVIHPLPDPSLAPGPTAWHREQNPRRTITPRNLLPPPAETVVKKKK